MKQFLKYTFASMVGFVLTVFIIGYLMVSAIGSFGDKKEVNVKDNSVIEIELDYLINERTMKNPFAAFGDDGFGKQLGLNDILKSIKHAKDDPKIKGIYLKSGYAIGGYSTLKEIHNALVDFRQSGKFVYAYADFYIQQGYYLASAADKVFLTPTGEFFFNGVQANVSFFTGTLDKIGVEMQAIKHGKYKGAVESFTLTELSEPNREQLRVLLEATFDDFLSDIAEARNLTKEELFKIADDLMIQSAQDAVNHKMVDELAYNDQVMESIGEKVGSAPDKINFIKLHKYASTVKGNYDRKNRIAIIYGQGEIGMGDDYDEESIKSGVMAKAIREARNDDNIKAIVIRINSPGGSSLASDIIWREVKLAKEKKPVIISMGDLAASGGYYIACAGDVIVAQPNTITGSIGVFALLPNAQGLLEDKLGMRSEKVKITKHADFGSISRPMTDYERETFQKGVDSAYYDFISKVADGRGMTIAEVDSIAQGRVWAGIHALKIGLVDELGGIDKAIAIAADKAKLEEYQIIELPKQESPFDELFEEFGMTASLKEELLQQSLGDQLYRNYNQFKSVLDYKGVQMRIPYNITLE